MLDVTRLRVLVAVARHGSVTAAARALNYAQPSVSHHLARLEAETGAMLTQRSGVSPSCPAWHWTRPVIPASRPSRCRVPAARCWR
jgi:DNA-binding transcriptional LysR family regulator